MTGLRVRVLRTLGGQTGATGNISAASDPSVAKGMSPADVSGTVPGEVAQATVSPVVEFLDPRGRVASSG